MNLNPSLLGRGIYLASIRTMYRVLATVGETSERRNQRAPHAYTKPSLTATAPNQVWTWDITKLATTQKGVFLMAYVIIDLFSRYVVGWMLAPKECKHLAAQLFAETIARHGIEPGLQVHMDRGSAMKSDTLAQLLASLGASRSFSRPRVSDDNPFSESQFKTMKYQPDYPGRFDGELHGRGWLHDFFGWHNDDHHHSSLALFTPADVFFGRVAVQVGGTSPFGLREPLPVFVERTVLDLERLWISGGRRGFLVALARAVKSVPSKPRCALRAACPVSHTPSSASARRAR